MNEFIKEVAELKMEHPELAKELDIILDMVSKCVQNEIFEGHLLIKRLLKNGTDK